MAIVSCARPFRDLVATVDPLGRWTRYERESHALRVTQAASTAQPLAVRYELDETGQLQAVSAEGSDGVRTTRTLKHRRLVDDFGQEVAADNPDAGREVRRFDGAGRMVQVLQADGSVADFEYDLAGRLLRRTVTPGGIPREAAKPHTVRYTYEAHRLVQIQDPEQTE
ncbi:MAG: RHS repeat domain-containing protein, partial [Pseudomonadota bacterium]